jgi:hypothetical protein
MPYDSNQNQPLVSLFNQKPCWMIEALATQLHYSIPSVRRFLTETGYYSSFTHNGGWYTLRSIPRFGRDGLWFYNNIGFSRAGSLTKTLIDLITRSPAGLNAEQLGERLSCRCHSVLVHLYRQGRLQREKQGRSYLYFAAELQTAASQHQALSRQHLQTTQLPAEIAVLLLVEFIRNPKSTFDQLAKKIGHSKNLTINVAQVERFFEQHGLKKTSQTGAPALYRY